MANKQSEPHPKNTLEWTVFGISLFLILSTLAYLTYAAASAPASASPDVSVAHQPEPSPNNPHRYRVTAYNHGGETAETVLIEFALMRGGRALETAQLEIPFLPKDSKRAGWVNFRADPATADSVVAWVVSYRKP